MVFIYLECTDTDFGETDLDGDDCDSYWTNVEDCGDYDGNGFVANSMCCACEGGNNEDKV